MRSIAGRVLFIAVVVPALAGAQEEIAILQPSDGETNDRFGWGLAIDGDTVVVGAPFHDALGDNAGAVYVFEKTGDRWGEQKLLASDGGDNVRFGRGVAIEGDTLVATGGFAAYVFRRLEGEWTETAKLEAADGTCLGRWIAMDSGVVTVSSDSCATEKAVRVFQFDGIAWYESHVIDCPDRGCTKLDYNDGVLVATRPPGQAMVSEFDGSSWTSWEPLVPSASGAGGSFNVFEVDCDADRIVLGAPSYGIETPEGWTQDVGAVTIFQRDAGGWLEEQVIVGASEGTFFGFSVSVDGETLLVGDQQFTQGTASLFLLDEPAWTSWTVLSASDGETDDGFGAVTDLQGGRAAVAGFISDSKRQESVYLFELPIGDGDVYGSGLNPPGSLVLGDGPAIGQSLLAGVDNPFGTQMIGSIPFMWISSAPDPAYPNGTLLPGYGMAFPGAQGELLIDLASLVDGASGSPWQGAGMPATVEIAVPFVTGLLGAEFFVQGALVDPGGRIRVGLTEAARIVVGL